jgi:hypothetical protein
VARSVAAAITTTGTTGLHFGAGLASVTVTTALAALAVLLSCSGIGRHDSVGDVVIEVPPRPPSVVPEVSGVVARVRVRAVVVYDADELERHHRARLPTRGRSVRLDDQHGRHDDWSMDLDFDALCSVVLEAHQLR